MDNKENYEIEGTVTEISNDGSFKLAGSEGYAIKQGEKRYNILCPKTTSEEKDAKACIILSQDFTFKSSAKNELIYHALGKRAKISVFVDKVEEKKISELEDFIKTNLTSVTLITIFAD